MAHTVEKIGGTSMTRFGELMDNVIIGSRKGAELYNRLFVVSAYGGITNMLLEDKKTGAPGIYGLFAADDKAWECKLEETRQQMLALNRSFEAIGLDVAKADAFVNERLDGVCVSLKNLGNLRSFGHLKLSDYLPASREFLSAVGEAHSAYNSTLILQAHGVNAVFVDLSGWKDADSKQMDEMISEGISGLDFSKCLPIVTGYVKCAGGIMKIFDRGYSEITFSRLAVISGASEGVIHKEFHLSTGDPKLMGVGNVKIIGHTNFDIADQLADMAMEAIHPKAAKEMERCNIPIRVKNAFDPENPGTVISRDYVSPEPRVEMICGRKDVIAIEVFDPDMVGQSGYDNILTGELEDYDISYICKNTNANTITHYVSTRNPGLQGCVASIKKRLPHAQVRCPEVAIVSVIGSNMKIPGLLSRAAAALASAGINVLALTQCMRQVNMQFVVGRNDYQQAQIALHHEFVEK